MTVKSKAKTKTASKNPATKKSAPASHTASIAKPSPGKTVKKAKPSTGTNAVMSEQPKARAKSAGSAPVAPVVVKRRVPTNVERRAVKAAARGPQFAFMKAPVTEHTFEVGDNVEVFCDHEKVRERVRGWIRGIVVQVDNKMVAVQFRSNVFLTDGWMVPDRILWYPLASEHIRPFGTKKAALKKDFIPDY
ncbi:MAG: hypothetical protein Q8L87_10475 [Anaerolineales bacterium]|jgi:hypothetical protein|nr:hypothetical protein [Anaerolineales bacterium]